MALDVLADLLSKESSPVMIALRKALPEATVNVFVDFDCPCAPYIAFQASGVNPPDKDTFVSAVDEGLAALARTGIHAELLTSTLAQKKLSLLLTPEDANLGVDASQAISLCWTYFNMI